MTPPSHLKVLFFDVFGTCVAQQPSVAQELLEATREAIQKNNSEDKGEKSIEPDVLSKAEAMTYDDWFEFGREWNREDTKYVQDSIAKTKTVDWKAVDQNRIELLPILLARHGLVKPNEDASKSPLQVGKGSLWGEEQLNHLGRAWHRLTPWPDTNSGLELLNKRFSTAALSNTYSGLMKGMVSLRNIPFTEVYTADMFDSFKPNPKVYHGAAEKMGVKPEECALVAAHLPDLKAAKACGYYAIYVERPYEEKSPELKNDGIPDMWIKENENGFETVAEQLGITAS